MTQAATPARQQVSKPNQSSAPAHAATAQEDVPQSFFGDLVRRIQQESSGGQQDVAPPPLRLQANLAQMSTVLTPPASKAKETAVPLTVPDAAPQVQQEAPPAGEKPAHGHSAPGPVKPVPAAVVEPPIVVAPVVMPVSPPFRPGISLRSAGADSGTAPSGTNEPVTAAANAISDNAAPVERLAVDDSALEVHIRLSAENSAPIVVNFIQEAPTPGTPAPVGSPVNTRESRKPQRQAEPVGGPDETVRLANIPEVPAKARQASVAASPALVVPEQAHTSTPAQLNTHDVNRTVAQALPPDVPATARKAADAPAPSNPDPLPERPETTQPLRALSLEFTPDGANDVRLRLSEHSGEVHISLHSADPSLSGRLHEGIHDLVGSLSTAGYDAEAWTPSQGRPNQGQPEDSPKRRRGNTGSGPDQFSGMLQQPIEEVI